MLGVTKELPRGKTELTPRYTMTLGDYVTAAEVTRSGTLCVAGRRRKTALLAADAGGNISFFAVD